MLRIEQHNILRQIHVRREIIFKPQTASRTKLDQQTDRTATTTIEHCLIVNNSATDKRCEQNGCKTKKPVIMAAPTPAQTTEAEPLVDIVSRLSNPWAEGLFHDLLKVQNCLC